MILKKFIKELERVAKKRGESIEVVMADGIPVVDPVYLENFVNRQTVVITDQK